MSSFNSLTDPGSRIQIYIRPIKKKKNILGQKFIVEGKMNPVGLYAMKGSKNQYNKEYYLETTLKF